MKGGFDVRGTHFKVDEFQVCVILLSAPNASRLYVQCKKCMAGVSAVYLLGAQTLCIEMGFWVYSPLTRVRSRPNTIKPAKESKVWRNALNRYTKITVRRNHVRRVTDFALPQWTQKRSS